MDFNTIFGLISSLLLVFVGIMLRFSNHENWRSYSKYWIWFVLIGSLLFAFKVYKYLA